MSINKTTRLILSICCLTFALTACGLFGSGNEDKTTIPGKIVFSMPDDTEKENYQIFVMNADGSGIQQLTHFENDEAFDPSWSPDGNEIVFTSTLRSTSLGLAIHIMDSDGENIRPMKLWPDSMHAYAGSNPTWSPSGSKIAFDWCVDCEMFGKNFEIFVYDFEMDSVFQVTDHLAGDTHPTWSPDGQQLAFASGREYYDADSLRFRSDLYIANTDETELQRLTESGYATIPKWHPDNSLIAYEWNIRGNNTYIIDVNSKEIVEMESDLEFEASPQWSIGGIYLIIIGRQNEVVPTELQLFSFKKNQFFFEKAIKDNAFLAKGRNFDWYYNENN